MASTASSATESRTNVLVVGRNAAAVCYAHLLEQSGRVAVTLVIGHGRLAGPAKKSGFDVRHGSQNATRWRPSRVLETVDLAADQMYTYVFAGMTDMKDIERLLVPQQGSAGQLAPVLVLLHNGSASALSANRYASSTLHAQTSVKADMRLLSDIVLVEYQGFEQVSLSVLDADEAGPSTAASLKEVAGLLRTGGTRVTVEDLSEGSSWGRASWDTATPPNGLYVETALPVGSGSSAFTHTTAQRRPPHRPGSASQPAIVDSPSASLSTGPPLYEGDEYSSALDGLISPKLGGFVNSPVYDGHAGSSTGIWKFVPSVVRTWLQGEQRMARPDSDNAYAEKGRRRRTGSFNYLPFHRNSSWRRRGKRKLSSIFWAVLLFTAVVSLVYVRRNFELQFEVSVYSKPWIQREVDDVPALSGCFAPNRISPKYNMTLHTSPKYHSLSPGVSLRHGMSCYDFSASIQSSPHSSLTPLIYHTYWRADLLPFGSRQAATLTSFLATQPLSHSRLILWTNGAEALKANPHVARFLKTWPEYVEVRGVDMEALAVGTALEGTGLIGDKVMDKKAWVDGDAVRLLVLWSFGGVWMDMDQIFTRDLHPLVEHEFVTQWDCYDKPYLSLNGALMHFRQHSPYLCEAFHIMASSPRPQPNTFTWGALLYAKLHRSLLKAHQTPFAVLPWCFADPRNCREDIRFPDPFKPNPEYWAGKRWDDDGRQNLEQRVGHVWSVHLHNQWNKAFPANGWIEKLLDGYAAQLDALEIFAKVGKQERHPNAGKRD